MSNNFDLAFEWIIEIEGGLVNNPTDPGGLTKYGICQRSYPDIDIRNLTLEEAKTIYYKNYWIPCKCDTFSFPVAICLFDTAVNMGCNCAIKLAQETTQQNIDGILGDRTIDGIRKMNFINFITNFMSYRSIRYSNINNSNAKRGWFNRQFKLTLYIAKQCGQSLFV